MTLVTMTHEDLPGVEHTASLQAYRNVWYANGWRSEDDPDFTGDPTTPAPPSVPVHAAEIIDAGLHGVNEFRWSTDGVSNLTRRVMVQDGSNAYAATVSGGYLRLTAAAAGEQQRECWQLPDTTSANSELHSVIGPADTLAGGVAQWGHIHRLRFDSGANLWRAWTVWTDTTIPVPTLLNYGIITFPGTGTMSINNVGNNPLAMALTALRYCSVVRAQRASNVVTCWTNTPRLPAIGSVGTLTGMAASGFNATSVTVTDADLSRFTFKFAQTAANATDADAGGEWQPATVAATTPFHLATRLVGSTLSAKIWSLEDAEPPWTDPVRVASYTISSGNPAPHAGQGACGLWAAHIQSGNRVRFGDVRWQHLAD